MSCTVSWSLRVLYEKDEQLYREERAKNEFMITQKQIFLQKVTDITEELQRKSISIDELN